MKGVSDQEQVAQAAAATFLPQTPMSAHRRLFSRGVTNPRLSFFLPSL